VTPLSPRIHPHDQPGGKGWGQPGWQAPGSDPVAAEPRTGELPQDEPKDAKVDELQAALGWPSREATA
jgi:hypothetical protein